MAENAAGPTCHIPSSYGAEDGAKSGSYCDSAEPCAAPSLPGRGIESTAYQAPEVDLYMKASPKLSPDTSNLLLSGPKLPHSALLSGESGDLIQPKWDDASKEGGKSAIHGDKREKWDMTTAPAAGLQILSDNEQHIATHEKAAGLFQSYSQATVSEKTYSDLESPSSPFEVLVGKTEFSNFSADSSGFGVQAGTFVETGWQMKSWISEPYENSGVRTAGDFPIGPPSYESVTLQATVANSLDFQGLSSPVLPGCDTNLKVFSADYVGQLNDQSSGFRGASPFTLFTDVMQRIPPNQIEHDNLHSQLNNPEDARGYCREKAPERPNETLQLGENLAKEVSTEANSEIRYRTRLSEDSSFVPYLLTSFETVESNWPDTSEMAEADSSGESDDTVIEDTKASLTLVGKKAEIDTPEKEGEPEKSGSEMILGESILSGPLTLVLATGQVAECESSPEELVYHEKSRLPYAIPEEDSEFIDDFETIQNPVIEVFDEKELFEQTKSIKELARLGGQKLETPFTLSEFSRASPVDVLKREDEQSVQNKGSCLSFDKTAETSEHPDSIHGESFKDFRKEWNAKCSKDLLETLAQVNEAIVDAGNRRESAIDLNTGGSLFKMLPLAETGIEGHGTFSQTGELANRYTSHGGTVSGVKLQPSPASPEAAAFFLDLNQEQLTITALRELSTIPDESPVSADESSPSPKENTPFMTADQREDEFAQFSEIISKITPMQEEVDVASAFPSIQFLQESQSQKGSSGTKELTKELVFAGLLTSCSVRDLVFWRDVKKSGMVFGTSLVVLLSLAAFSVISVIAYLILALLSVTISFRVYRSVIQAVQKSEEGHPFKPWLDVDLSVSSEAFHNHVNSSLVYVNKALKQVIRLFLVQDLVDSLKLAVCMWLMTYVGAVFNGITLLILGLLMAFTVPKVYEKYQPNPWIGLPPADAKTQIDHYISIIRERSKAILAKVHAKLPGLAKKKAE